MCTSTEVSNTKWGGRKSSPKGFSSPCIVSQPWRPSYQQSSVFGSSVYKYNFPTDVEKIINRAENDKGLKRDIWIPTSFLLSQKDHSQKSKHFATLSFVNWNGPKTINTLCCCPRKSISSSWYLEVLGCFVPRVLDYVYSKTTQHSTWCACLHFQLHEGIAFFADAVGGSTWQETSEYWKAMSVPGPMAVFCAFLKEETSCF